MGVGLSVNDLIDSEGLPARALCSDFISRKAARQLAKRNKYSWRKARVYFDAVADEGGRVSRMQLLWGIDLICRDEEKRRASLLASRAAAGDSLLSSLLNRHRTPDPMRSPQSPFHALLQFSADAIPNRPAFSFH